MLAFALIAVNSANSSLLRPVRIQSETQPPPLAGAWARAKANDRRRLRRVIGVIGLLGCAAIIFLGSRGNWLLTLGALAGLAFINRALLPMMIHLFHRQGQAARGADAELKVAEALAGDPENLLVQHNVAGPYGDLDHVIVRRNGAIVVIDTKSHRGRVTDMEGRLQLNGRSFEKDIVRQARGNAMRLKDQFQSQLQLRVYVHAALVFPNAYVAVRKPVQGVDVAHLSYLATYLNRLPPDRRVQELMLRDPTQIERAISGSASSASVPQVNNSIP